MKMSGTQLVDFDCLLNMILLCSQVNPLVGTVGSSLSYLTSHPLKMLNSREAPR